MLFRLLQLIAAEGHGDCAALAKRLGVSEALMAQMLDTLNREGYLKSATTAAAGCGRCPHYRDCPLGAVFRLWMLTAKGQRTLAKQGKGLPSST